MYRAACLLLLLSNFALAQRVSGKQQLNVDVRITTQQGPLQDPVRVQLVTISGATAYENYCYNGTTQFTGIGEGSYRIRVTGPTIEDTETGSFTVTSDFPGGNNIQYVSVKMRSSVAGSASASSKPAGSTYELNIPGKARDELKKGIEAVKKGDSTKAYAHMNKAIRIYPQYAAAYNNLGFLYLRDKDVPHAKEAFEKAVTYKDQSGMAYLNLAQMAIQQRDYARTIEMANQSLALNPLRVEALTFAANAELATGKYDDAMKHARKVHTLPHEQLAVSHIICAVALEKLNQPKEAVAEYELFLKEDPSSPRAAGVKKDLQRLSAQAQAAPPAEATFGTDVFGFDSAPMPFTIDATGFGQSKLLKSSDAWAPPDIDQYVPATKPQPCPLPEILKGVAQRTEELVLNLKSFSATETLEYTELPRNGGNGPQKRARVSYVAEFRDAGGGTVEVVEYRNDSSMVFPFASGLAAKGTVIAALIFHPMYVRNFAVDCEGMSEVNGVAAWQMHFVQVPGPNDFRRYKVNSDSYSVTLKGRAWIAADTYQVLRMEHDLARPIPELRLRRDYVAVEYGAVDFPRNGVQMWLPQRSTLYIDFAGQRYKLSHQFSDFKLFWVDVKQDVKLPQ